MRFFFIIIFISLGCSSASNQEEESVSFQVNDDYLGSIVLDSSARVSFKPPKEFHPINNDSTEVILGIIGQQGLLGDVKYAFTDSINHILVTYANITHVSGLKLDSLINKSNYRTERWDNINISAFKSNGLIIDQVILSNEQIVNFKVICKDSREFGRVIIDYFILYSEYEKFLPYLESSIGTIKFI